MEYRRLERGEIEQGAGLRTGYGVNGSEAIGFSRGRRCFPLDSSQPSILLAYKFGQHA